MARIGEHSQGRVGNREREFIGGVQAPTAMWQTDLPVMNWLSSMKGGGACVGGL